MRITVERTMGESYLVIEEENPEDALDPLFLETRMLSENRIDRLLPLLVRSTGGNTRYQYPVSGLTSIGKLYEGSMMGKQDLRSFLTDLKAALVSAEEYLISAEHILLDPEYIFRDLKDNTFLFCACPVWESSLQEKLQALAEYLITVTDHSQDEAIDLSYGFYRYAAAGDYGFDRLLEDGGTCEREKEPDDPVTKKQPAGEKQEAKISRGSASSGAFGILGFAAVFALVLCFTLCLLLLKFR